MTARRFLALALVSVVIAVLALYVGAVAGYAAPVRRALILVCPADVAPQACDRDTASDVIVGPAGPSPASCLIGGVGTAARAPDLSAGGYVKIVCEGR